MVVSGLYNEYYELYVELGMIPEEAEAEPMHNAELF